MPGATDSYADRLGEISVRESILKRSRGRQEPYAGICLPDSAWRITPPNIARSNCPSKAAYGYAI